MEGRYCRLEPLDPQRHGDGLFLASTPPDAAARFLYLPVRAPADRAEFDAWMVNRSASVDPLYFAVIDKSIGAVGGRQSFLRIDPANQSIEIGDIYWGPGISRYTFRPGNTFWSPLKRWNLPSKIRGPGRVGLNMQA